MFSVTDLHEQGEAYSLFITVVRMCTVGAIYIGAAKSIGAALFAAILGHLKKTFSTFSFRIIYFRMSRIRI